jgi:hypothetical protein
MFGALLTLLPVVTSSFSKVLVEVSLVVGCKRSETSEACEAIGCSSCCMIVFCSSAIFTLLFPKICFGGVSLLAK